MWSWIPTAKGRTRERWREEVRRERETCTKVFPPQQNFKLYMDIMVFHTFLCTQNLFLKVDELVRANQCWSPSSAAHSLPWPCLCERGSREEAWSHEALRPGVARPLTCLLPDITRPGATHHRPIRPGACSSWQPRAQWESPDPTQVGRRWRKGGNQTWVKKVVSFHPEINLCLIELGPPSESNGAFPVSAGPSLSLSTDRCLLTECFKGPRPWEMYSLNQLLDSTKLFQKM